MKHWIELDPVTWCSIIWMQKLLLESKETHNPRYVKYIQFYCKIKIELVQQWSTFWNSQFWTKLNWNYFWLPFKVFSRESDSRDSVVRSSVRPSVRPSRFFKSIINQEFFKHYESRVFQALWIKSFSSVMNQEFFKNNKSAFLKRFLSVFLSWLLSVKRLFMQAFERI